MSKGKGHWEFVNPSDVSPPSKPRHKRLRPDQTEKLQFIWDSMGPLCGAPTLEKLDYNMRCDSYPDREIIIMVAIARAFLAFTKKHRNVEGKKLAVDLIMLSLGNPIFRKHSRELEETLRRCYAAEKRKFYREFGEDAKELLLDYPEFNT